MPAYFAFEWAAFAAVIAVVAWPDMIENAVGVAVMASLFGTCVGAWMRDRIS